MPARRTYYTIIMLTLFFLLASCTETNGAPNISVRSFYKAPTDRRYRYIAVIIEANTRVKNYFLGLLESSKPAPSVPELLKPRGYSFPRNLALRPINVLLFAALDSKRINEKEHQKLLDPVTGYDGRETLLKPDTSYTLYGAQSGDNSVEILGTFSTDPILEEELRTTGPPVLIDSKLAGASFSIRNAERFIVPTVVQSEYPFAFSPETLDNANREYTVDENRVIVTLWALKFPPSINYDLDYASPDLSNVIEYQIFTDVAGLSRPARSTDYKNSTFRLRGDNPHEVYLSTVFAPAEREADQEINTIFYTGSGQSATTEQLKSATRGASISSQTIYFLRN